MNADLEVIEAVSRAADRVKRRGRFGELELSNKIVLSIKPVPPLMLNAVNKEFEPPPPPKVYIEEKGREEENPNDPTYIKLLEKLEEANNEAINNMVLALGTAVKSVPDGFFPPENDGWIASVEFAFSLSGKNITIERNDPIQRYLCWLRYYALETSLDAALVNILPMQLTGIQEGEVQEVVDSFRSVQGRGTDTERETAPGSQNGNSANRATRRSRARDRGA